MSEILYPLRCPEESCKANRDDRQGIHSWWCPENPWDEAQIRGYVKVKPWLTRRVVEQIAAELKASKKGNKS